jgi:hypothetical protein
MTRRLALAIGLAFVAIALTSMIETNAVMARTVVGSDSCGSMQDSGFEGMTMSPNVHSIDERPYNFTFPMNYRPKHRFPADYSNGLPDFSGTGSDTTESLGTPTIPEFPSFLITLLFMVAMLLGAIILKTRQIV